MAKKARKQPHDALVHIRFCHCWMHLVQSIGSSGAAAAGAVLYRLDTHCCELVGRGADTSKGYSNTSDGVT